MLIKMNLLTDMYHQNAVSDFERFAAVAVNLAKYFGILYNIILIVYIIVIPVIIIFVLKNLQELDRAIYFMVIGVCYLFLYQFSPIFNGIISKTYEDKQNEFYKDLSPYSYSYNYDFVAQISEKIKLINENSFSILMILSLMITLILQQIVLFKEMKSSILLFLQFLSMMFPFIFYLFNCINVYVASLSTSTNDTYMQQLYDSELKEEKKRNNQKPLKTPYIIFSLVMCILFGLLEAWNAKEINQLDIKELFWDFVYILMKFFDKSGAVKATRDCKNISLLAKWIPNIIQLPLWFGVSLLSSFVDSILFIVKDYDIYSSVTYKQWELDNIKSVNQINSVELYIDKYMYINMSKELIRDNSDAIFFNQFDNILSSGNIDSAERHLETCKNLEMKAFLTDQINNDDNLLLSNVGMSFSSKCNSFLIDKTNEIQNEYVSLISPRGRIVLIKGESGSGKSTINNSLAGNNRFISSFINGHSGFLIDSKSKKLIPCFSDQYDIYNESSTLLFNFELVDKTVNNKELLYLWKYLGIEKYFIERNETMGMIHFSKGQRDRMTISKIFVALNSLVKQYNSNDLEILSALSNDIDDELDGKDIKLPSFIVFLDEPLRALDKISARKVMELIKKYTKFGFTFIIIEHSDIDEHADDVIKIEDKTCKYSTKVNGKSVDIKDLKFRDGNTLILGDTIAYKHTCNKPPVVEEIVEDYKSEKAHDIYICNIDENMKSILLNQLRNNYDERSTNADDDNYQNSIENEGQIIEV